MSGYSIFQNKYPYQQIEKIFNEYYLAEGFDIAVGKGTFCFPVFLSEKLCNDNFEELDLDLTMRDYMALRNANFKTIRDLCERYEEMISMMKDKKHISIFSRNMMSVLFLYQFENLKTEQKREYLELVVELSLADADPKLSDYYIGKPYVIMMYSSDNPSMTRSYQGDIQTFIFHDTLFTITDMDDEEDIYYT